MSQVLIIGASHLVSKTVAPVIVESALAVTHVVKGFTRQASGSNLLQKSMAATKDIATKALDVNPQKALAWDFAANLAMGTKYRDYKSTEAGVFLEESRDNAHASSVYTEHLMFDLMLGNASSMFDA